MKIFLQRVSMYTAVRCQEDLASEVFEDSFAGVGFVALLGWMKSDEAHADLDAAEAWLMDKAQGLRVFPDADGKMNLNLEKYLEANEVEGGILWVPQFTLAGRLDSGYRPSFTDAMSPPLAKRRFEAFIAKLGAEKKSYKQIFGRFGANMELSFTNWGPVSLMLER
ncbi:MAG: D-aminoacyl-tRNA deacylase [Bdellovibrionota bacterium]